jgi:hypothetical protein
MTSIFMTILLAAIFPGAKQAHAEEKRCKDLGANCVCSEPLNTNSYSLVAGTTWAYNPADSAAKECAVEGAQGGVIEDNSFRYSPVSSGETINALPAGRTNTWVLTTVNDASNPAGGGMFVGTHFPDSSPTARIALRGYRYYSSTYTFTNQTSTCANSSKLMQFGPNAPLLDGASGSHQLYAWTSATWNLPSGFDCCWFGPGPTNVQGTYTSGNFRGKWYRIEAVVRNTLPTGPTTVIEIYRKNVTDNGPEEKIIDTAIPTSQPVGTQWTAALAGSLKPRNRVNEVWFNLFRRDKCEGFVGLSHIMAAAWDTDNGQRIGGAYEIEGGAAPSPDSTAPSVSILSPANGSTVSIRINAESI